MIVCKWHKLRVFLDYSPLLLLLFLFFVIFAVHLKVMLVNNLLIKDSTYFLIP